MGLIKEHNSNVIMPKSNEFLSEKNVVLAWIGYNTPSIKDTSITPLVGTGFSSFLDMEDQTPFSLYKQWVISLYLLTWEYNILLAVYLSLVSGSVDLYSDITDLKDKSSIYWFNRQQFFMLNLEESLNKKGRFILDMYSNKFIFKREVFEDISYVALNLILGHSIINAFENIDINSISEDEFFNILKDIISKHYIIYSKQYEYLNKLRLYRINNYYSVNDLFEINKEFIN